MTKGVYPLNLGTHVEWVWIIKNGLVYYAGSCKSKEEAERAVKNKLKEINYGLEEDER